jgi:hypothetical protein
MCSSYCKKKNNSGDPLAAHAVHLALALFELNLLHLPENIQSPLLSRDPGERGPARLVFSFLFFLFST